MLRRLVLLFVVLVVLASLLAKRATVEEKVLRVYNWPDYIAADTLARFEAETGIRVIYDIFDSNEALHEVVMLGASSHDIVVPSATYMGRHIAAGMYQPLNRELIPNRSGLDPALMAEAARHDPGNAHGVIYLWGTSGLGYNPAMVAERLGPEAPVDSWSLIFDPENAARLADCGIGVLDSGDEVIPLVLNWLGLPPESDRAEDLERAAEALRAIRPHLRMIDSVNYIDALAEGALCVALGWSGDMFIAEERAAEGVELAYSIPHEGTVVWFDMLAIPTDAPNPQAAHAFIDFVLRPDVIADISNTVYYANAVPGSLELLDGAVRDDPAIYPDRKVRARLFGQPRQDVPGARAITRLWTALRDGS